MSKLSQTRLYRWVIQSPTLNVLMGIRHPVTVLKYLRIRRRSDLPKVLSLEQSLQKIVDEHLSVARFGDGELRWMLGVSSYGFQSASARLASRLREVLTTQDPGQCAICIPDVFNGLSAYVPQNKDAWIKLIANYYPSWAPYLQQQSFYYDANITRFYIDRRDKTQATRYFNLLKAIWKAKRVLIIEGAGTRFGVGNDLLEDAVEVRRIICPSENAFDVYDEIVAEINAHAKDNEVYLIALGPSATVMAFDLSKQGYQAIDIGHADLEYEWFLAGARERVNLADRYVGEISGGAEVQAEVQPEYNNQIIATIKGD